MKPESNEGVTAVWTFRSFLGYSRPSKSSALSLSLYSAEEGPGRRQGVDGQNFAVAQASATLLEDAQPPEEHAGIVSSDPSLEATLDLKFGITTSSG